MPNWIKGEIKIKGTPKNIINFFKNGLTHVMIKKDEPNIFIGVVDPHSFYVKDSRRQFIEQDIVFLYQDNKEHIISLQYQGAWGIDAEALAKLSKSFKIDFKVYGWERGAEFESFYHIKRGRIISDKHYSYDDYSWESDFPTVGG